MFVAGLKEHNLQGERGKKPTGPGRAAQAAVALLDA